GARANPVPLYRRGIDDFTHYLTGKRKEVATATSDELRAHLAGLAKKGFKASSLARRLSAIRQLYRFLYAEGHRPDDPAAVLEGPRRGEAVPKILSVDEVDRLLAAARDAIVAETSAARRLRAARLNRLVEVLYAT